MSVKSNKILEKPQIQVKYKKYKEWGLNPIKIWKRPKSKYYLENIKIEAQIKLKLGKGRNTCQILLIFGKYKKFKPKFN